MRYRVLSRGKAKHLSIPEKPAEKTASLKAADLDNPYGRVFGTPRSNLSPFPDVCYKKKHMAIPQIANKCSG